MTKRYTLTTTVMTTDGWKVVTETKTVTDRMEERDHWKAGYAKQWFRAKHNLNGIHRITILENLI